ncbi:PREDICTED: NAD kinase-like isoform X1 [Amphimedon queenslandica]|uniref:NAD(+) kinase n=1 Tax=Amphimedon queenslandica TaxID=400682 RepID=A0A1X7UYZ7_AMPQE|nr:PREDICTED: NAD kinase-like isoform X1 [Amphimedon queenslandica]|eukprot:XP_019851699.1 PREDICTED: NAD kinase-like isoform X1 [Amphimedon queenslandica]
MAGMARAEPDMSNAAEKKRQSYKYYNQRSQLDFYPEQTDSDEEPKSKAMIQKASDMSGIEDPSCDHHLLWREAPKRVLLMKKFRDEEVTATFKNVAKWLIEEMNAVIICEPAVLKENLICQEEFSSISRQFLTWKDEDEDSEEEDSKEKVLSDIDIIICIGGDGTLLYTSSMFQDGTAVPPVLSFNNGSLGFLTPFPITEYKSHIQRVFKGKVSITLRHRLICEIRANNKVALPLSPDNEDICHVDYCKDHPVSPPPNDMRRLSKFSTKVMISSQDKLKTKMMVMNEVVVDRGPSPYLTNLELCCNGRPMTSVQGDGIIIATPTGSTAYSLAAGASMVHPSVPCMLISPICPHSLSFRSIVIPAGVEISVTVATESRNSAWVSFDGRNRQEIFQGDCVVVTTSSCPVPSVNNTGHVTDWFDSLAECLHWNIRKQQKKL